jgi:UDP-N-acetylglucosamine--N-acetylmuramyl-(pentapeptide) pyrophosphoryl-undecaprenol N-acetylglucosamine transferase
MVRVAISGGGTGGHIAPALAVGEALERLLGESEVDVTYYSTDRPVDREMYGDAGVECRVIDSPRIDKGGIAARLALPFRALRACRQARVYLRSDHTEVAFGTGGYSSFFVLLAARLLGIPAALHDSNALPGRSNRLASRFCDRVFTGFESAGGFFGKKAVFTGNPVRSGLLLAELDRDSAAAELGLEVREAVVLFLGGSQGASFLNDLALEAPDEISVVAQTGERDFERVRQRARADSSMVVLPFHHRMSLLYSCADLVVARAGAMTLTEIEHYSLPCVLIPYPHAMDDHQTVNASEFCRDGRGLLVQQSEIDQGAFWQLVGDLFTEGSRLESMKLAYEGARAKRGGRPSETIARSLLDLAGKGST